MEEEESKAPLIVAFGLLGVSGFLVGLLLGWLIWHH